MRKGILVVFSIFLVSMSFGAVKFKGDFIGIGDFKYIQSNYVYNNVPTDPYFGLDNVEFIVNLGAKLELTSDIYGVANLIVQPTTKFKHIAVDNLMVNYFHKASKLKIVPFYRYRTVKFDDPENSVGWFNSWVISSSVFGVGNITNSKVDNDGFYVDSSSTARAGGIPYILRPVEFMDGTIVSMPGMGEDTTNLSLVGRDVGGFYAEQKAKSYLWQVFLGGFFIDGSEGALNLAGAANVKFNDVFEIEDILNISFGIDGSLYSFGSRYSLVDYYDLVNSYRIGSIPNKGFRTLQSLNVYLNFDTGIANLYAKGGIIGQGIIKVSNDVFNEYIEGIEGNGYRFSGGVFSEVIGGIKLQLSGEYVSLNVFTNTNSYYNATRMAFNYKILGSYDLIVGGNFKLIFDGGYSSERSFNDVYKFIDYEAVDFASQGRMSIGDLIFVKSGIGVDGLLDFLGIYVIGSYQNLTFRPEEFRSVKLNYNVTTIEIRNGIDISFDILGLEGLGINSGGRYFSWVDNLRSSRLLLNVISDTKDLSLSYYSVYGYIYYKVDNVYLRLGYGYPIFGDLYDIDFGLISDSLRDYFYKGVDGKYEGLYANYVLQNLPRLFVDLKISF